MNTKFVSAVAVLTALTVISTSAQDAKAQSVTKAEVQKAVENLKANQEKYSLFCDYAKLFKQSEELSKKDENDPQLKAIDSQMDDIASKLGPNAERIFTAYSGDDLDDDSEALIQELAKTCK